jgi:ribonuclease P protein component
MKLHSLRGRKTCEKVLRHGRVWKGRTLVVRLDTRRPRTAREKEMGLFVGTLASGKLHKSAVVRNRMRRRCREALRIVVKDMKTLPDAQLILAPRLVSLTCPFEEIVVDVRTFLSILSKL